MKTENIVTTGVLGLLAALGLTLLVGGCMNSSTTTGDLDDSAVAPTSASADDAGAVAVGDARTGAELWADNCNRCHNSRSPAERSDAEWDVIATHMRLQATLTGEEFRKILAFLKTAN